MSANSSMDTLPVHKVQTDLEKGNSDPADLSQKQEQAGTDDLDGNLSRKATLSDHNDVRRVTTALDWTGPDDEENPVNWTWGWKWYHVMIVGAQSFTITFGSSVVSPAIVAIADEFHVSHVAATLTLSIYVLGLAFGPMIAAPVSETWGRRVVYMVLFPMSLLFGLGASLAQNFGTLIVCRLLAGLLGSGVLAVGGGTTADLFPPTKRAPGAALFVLWPFLGPAFAPPVGSYTTQYKNWRWPLYTILMLGAFTSLLTLRMRETHKQMILKRRAKRLGLEPPPSPLPSRLGPRMKAIVLVTLLRPTRMLLMEPIVTFLSIYTAFNFAVLFGFFAAFPVVFRSIYPEVQAYHFGLGASGLVFLAIAIGCLIASVIFVYINQRLQKAKTQKAQSDPNAVATLVPEERMVPAMIGCFFLPIGLFWFAWTARPSIHWIVPVIATVFFGMGNLLLFDSTIIYMMDAYGAKESASANAANGLLRYIAGAAFPLFMVQFIRAVGVGWCVSTLGFVTVLLCPIPWVLYRWGAKIRAKSAYAKA